jgi:DNA-directed RNA polymerase subunit beta'
VKYVLVQKADADFKKKITAKVKEDYEAKLKELQELYKSELAEHKENPKQIKETERLVEENKESLEKEFNRIKSIVSDLEVGSTIFENDFRHIFAKFATLAIFQSGPEALLKMLQNINVEDEIKKRIKEFTQIKSEDQKKKSIALIKLLINLHVSGVKPENMVIKKLPVIPPDLRPVVQLE